MFNPVEANPIHDYGCWIICDVLYIYYPGVCGYNITCISGSSLQFQHDMTLSGKQWLSPAGCRDLLCVPHVMGHIFRNAAAVTG